MLEKKSKNLDAVANKFSTRTSSSFCDMNKDGIINMKDLGIIVLNFLKNNA